MAAAEHVARLRAAFAAFSEGNPAPFLALIGADVVYRLIGTTALSGTFRGRPQVIERLFAPLGAALATPLVLDLGTVMSDGDRIAVQAEGRARLQSGAPYDNTYCFVFRFVGGGKSGRPIRLGQFH